MNIFMNILIGVKENIHSNQGTNGIYKQWLGRLILLIYILLSEV